MAKFCSNCGKELREGARFCVNCGAKADDTQDVKTETQSEERLIIQGKGTLYGSGPAAAGTVTLTNLHLTFQKSNVNFVGVGLLTLLSKSELSVPLNTIFKIEKISVPGAAGFKVQSANGSYKLSFNSMNPFSSEPKNNRDILINYIEKAIKESK